MGYETVEQGVVLEQIFRRVMLDLIWPIGHYLRRLKARFGPAGAITATARKIATIFYTLVRRQVEFDDSLWQASEAETTEPALVS